MKNQLNVFLNAAKTFKIDQQICDILDQIEQLTSLEGVDNEVAKAYGNVALILATFENPIFFRCSWKTLRRVELEKWASNQPDVDCVFETEESSNRELAYCKVLRDENYDLIFLTKKTSGLYSSKLESLYQIYNGQPVQTEIKRNKISVCAFEWKVDQYIRIFEPEMVVVLSLLQALYRLMRVFVFTIIRTLADSTLFERECIGFTTI